MTHRHINSGKELSSAAIDDIIGRGSLADWGEHCGRECLMPKFAFLPTPANNCSYKNCCAHGPDGSRDGFVLSTRGELYT